MKTKFKWQKEYLKEIKKLTDEELFDKICFECKSFDRWERRDDFKVEVLVTLFKKRMKGRNY